MFEPIGVGVTDRLSPLPDWSRYQLLEHRTSYRWPI